MLLVVHCSSYILQRYKNMVCDVAPGAAVVLLVLLLFIRLVFYAYVTQKLRQGLRMTQLKSHVPDILLLPLLPQKRTEDPLIDVFTTEGMCDLGDFPICMKAFPYSVQGRLRHFVLPQEISVTHS